MLVLTSFICCQMTRDGKINQNENIVSEQCVFVFVLHYIFLKLFLHFSFDHQNDLTIVMQ